MYRCPARKPPIQRRRADSACAIDAFGKADLHAVAQQDRLATRGLEVRATARNGSIEVLARQGRGARGLRALVIPTVRHRDHALQEVVAQLYGQAQLASCPTHEDHQHMQQAEQQIGVRTGANEPVLADLVRRLGAAPISLSACSQLMRSKPPGPRLRGKSRRSGS